MTKCPDRRALPRIPVVGMTATVRVSGRFVRQSATVVDFNREGATLRLDTALRTEKPVYVSVSKPPLHLDSIVGVIHNCRPAEDGGFRCGVQFRTGSRLQFDREATEAMLREIERTLQDSSPQPEHLRHRAT